MTSGLPYPDNPGSTHYDECWRDRGHHNCALREIERLNEIILELERTRAEDGRRRANCYECGKD